MNLMRKYTVTETNEKQSGGVRLICFDLDGTLYRDDVIYMHIPAHFLGDTPYRAWIPELQAEMRRILEGKAQLRCGQFVPKKTAERPGAPRDLLDVKGETALLLEQPGEYLDRTRYSYISDGWTLAMYLARRAGYSGDAFWERFQLARKELESEPYGPKPDARIQNLLARLREMNVYLVLCSNSKEAGGKRLLKRLGLENSFDELVFDADKPASMAERIQDWRARLGISPHEMLFVGDQGYFDLYPAKQAGARTLLVSALHPADAELWDMRVNTMEEMEDVLMRKVFEWR